MKNVILTFAISLALMPNVFSQTRVVLIEQFSNSSCPPCGAISPSVYAFADNTPNVAAIAYHTLFPYNNDSMHFENPVEATQRAAYYSVVGVPHSVFDGNVYNGPTNPFFSTISTSVSNRLNVEPRYSIEASSLILSGNQLTGSFRFTSLSGMNAAENLVGHVVIIEKNVLKSSYAASPGTNNETEYGYVMRKMIPNASGSNFTNTNINASDSINLNWTLDHIKNKAELRIVAFVQNAATKEVYQAQLFSLSESPVGLTEDVRSSNEALIYPTPAASEFSIFFKSRHYVKSITILDQLGKVLFEEHLNIITDNILKTIELSAGVYSVRITTETGSKILKLIIAK